MRTIYDAIFELIFENFLRLFWRILLLTAVGAAIGFAIGGTGWTPQVIILSVIGLVLGFFWQLRAEE